MKKTTEFVCLQDFDLKIYMICFEFVLPLPCNIWPWGMVLPEWYCAKAPPERGVPLSGLKYIKGGRDFKIWGIYERVGKSIIQVFKIIIKDF